MAEHVVTDADNEKTIEVRKGDSLTLQLPENPTTGYRWNLDQHDPSILEHVGGSTFASSGPAIGAGGRKSFTFVARAKGNTDIVLSLRRAWENEKPARKQFHVRIKVHD